MELEIKRELEDNIAEIERDIRKLGELLKDEELKAPDKQDINLIRSLKEDLAILHTQLKTKTNELIKIEELEL